MYDIYFSSDSIQDLILANEFQIFEFSRWYGYVIHVHVDTTSKALGFEKNKQKNRKSSQCSLSYSLLVTNLECIINELFMSHSFIIMNE